MSMWTVYHRPADYPDAVYLARRWEIYPTGPEPTPDVLVAKELRELRRQLERRGLGAITRSPDDDAGIVETWL